MSTEYSLDTSLDSRAKDLDPFTLAYITAAFWTMTDDDGNSLDYLGLHDLSDTALASMRADCEAFQNDAAGIMDSLDASLCGHDFWLTRNHHGAGFWDRGYGQETEDTLTAASHAYGSADLYIGDDGMVYCS